MTAYNTFTVAMNEALEELRAAEHSVSFTAHVMEMDPSDRSIADYEKALDYASAARRKIGEINDAEMRQRSIDASLKISETAVDVVESPLFDMAAAYKKHEAAALRDRT